MSFKLKGAESPRAIAILLSAVYMASYITRVNLAAIVTEVEAASGIPRSSLSFAITASFIFYGMGQIIGGALGDRISPKTEVAAGLILTTLMNFLMPLCTSAVMMTVLWSVNGFAQSLMWPPVVKIMATALSDDDFKRTTTAVSLFGTVGSVCVYLFAPLIITLLGYKWVFVISGLCGALMLGAWLAFAKSKYRRRDVGVPVEELSHEGFREAASAEISNGGVSVEGSDESLPSEKDRGVRYNIFTPIAILLLVATALQGALRDGVTTWTPTYISDTFSLGSEISILTGVILPIFAMISVYLTSFVYRKCNINPITLSGIIFAAAAVFALLLLLFGEDMVVLSVLFTALLTACMHAINFLLIGMVPGFLSRYSNISFLSGVINSATYVGSALSTYGIAALSESFGWELTITVWVIIAAAGAVISLLVARPFIRSATVSEP